MVYPSPHKHSYSITGLFSTGMGDCLQIGKPSQYVCGEISLKACFLFFDFALQTGNSIGVSPQTWVWSWRRLSLGVAAAGVRSVPACLQTLVPSLPSHSASLPPPANGRHNACLHTEVANFRQNCNGKLQISDRADYECSIFRFCH